MSMESAREAVKAGAAKLDDYVFGGGVHITPDWRKKIDLDALDMGSCDSCVLGQLFGDYGTGVDVLNLPYGKGSELGFDSNQPDFNYEEVQAAWVVLLKPDTAPSGGAESLWEHKNNSHRNIRIAGGTVTVSGQEYWPVSYGYMMGDEFFASGDPTLMRTADLYMEYKPYEPKPKFPVGSFLTDKKTQKEIFFVAPTCVYRMHINANGQMVRATGPDAIDFYADKYGPLTPVRKKNGEPVAFKIAE